MYVSCGSDNPTSVLVVEEMIIVFEQGMTCVWWVVVCRFKAVEW